MATMDTVAQFNISIANAIDRRINKFVAELDRAERRWNVADSEGDWETLNATEAEIGVLNDLIDGWGNLWKNLFTK